jgi:hypothetical protein
MKPKKCRSCGEKFQPIQSTLQVCCSHLCAIDYARVKEIDKKHKELKKNSIGRNELIKALQIKVNAMVREIDKDFGCICCGKITDKPHAGHYYHAGGHSWMRFNFLNIWTSCYNCNVNLSGNIAHYTKSIEKLNVLQRLHNDLLSTRENKPTLDQLKQSIKIIDTLKKQFKIIYPNKLTDSERVGVRLWLNDNLGIY